MFCRYKKPTRRSLETSEYLAAIKSNSSINYEDIVTISGLGGGDDSTNLPVRNESTLSR